MNPPAKKDDITSMMIKKLLDIKIVLSELNNFKKKHVDFQKYGQKGKKPIKKAE